MDSILHTFRYRNRLSIKGNITMTELISVGMAGFITTKIVKVLGEKDIADLIWALTLTMVGVVFVVTVLPEIEAYMAALPDKMGKALYDILMYPVKELVDYFKGGALHKPTLIVPQTGGSSGTW